MIIRNGGAVLRAENFGDLITADHKVLSENCESRNTHRYGVVVQDLAYSMDSILSVQNKDFSGDGKECTKVSRTVGFELRGTGSSAKVQNPYCHTHCQ